jgi:hypothetical protein
MGSSTGAFTRSTGSYVVGGSTPALLADSFVTGPGDATGAFIRSNATTGIGAGGYGFG